MTGLSTTATLGADARARFIADYSQRIGQSTGRPVDFLIDKSPEAVAAISESTGLDRAGLIFFDAMLGYFPPNERATLAETVFMGDFADRIDALTVTRTLIWMLTDAKHGVRKLAQQANVICLIDAVAHLQSQILAGVTVTKSDWRGLRAKVDIDIDQESPAFDRRDGSALACANACAWPVASSPASATEALRAWYLMTDAIVDAEQGWTMPDYDRLQEMMDAIFADTAEARERGERINFEELAREREPELSKRWRANLDRRKELQIEWRAALAATLIGGAQGHRP